MRYFPLLIPSLSIIIFSFIFADFANAAKSGTARKCGKASWYSLKGRTASGARNNPKAMTAAHRRLKFGRTVTVKNMRNGRKVKVRINDRGPFVRGRIIDVSKAAARKLGFLSRGVTRVCITW